MRNLMRRLVAIRRVISLRHGEVEARATVVLTKRTVSVEAVTIRELTEEEVRQRELEWARLPW